MIISGLANLTLLDYPGKTACTVFTGGCNLRCPFCHNATLVTEDFRSLEIGEESVFSLLEKRKGILDGVCITGGEPLIQKDIDKFISKIKDMGFSVKLDTNGSFPSVLKDLLSKKLVDYVAMDIKNSKARYGETVGIDNFDTIEIERSVDILKSTDTDYEFRTTVCREFHSVEEIEEIARWISGCNKYFLQAFKDSGNLIGQGLHSLEKDEISEMAAVAGQYVSAVGIRGI